MPIGPKAPLRRDQALAYIIERVARLGTCPTFEEIGRALGVSKARARQLVDELVARKLIEKTPGAQRNLRICDVARCRSMLDVLRATDRMAGDRFGAPSPQVQLPVLPPFEHLPDEH